MHRPAGSRSSTGEAGWPQLVTRNADTYIAYLYGRERADGTWEGRITFERTTDRARFTTPVETTQSII